MEQILVTVDAEDVEARSQGGVVGVGSEAGVQIRDQSNGSMADETIVRVFDGN